MFTLSDAQTEITEYSDTRLISDYYVGKRNMAKYGAIEQNVCIRKMISYMTITANWFMYGL